MKIDNTQFQNIRKWMYRNARPLDLARWQFHFENGSKENVLHALSAYQNEDGGFAHALEPDMWNPNSNGIQTWFAVELLRKTRLEDSSHPIIQGIIRFLNSGEGFVSEIESTNKYPHAPWWHWRPDGNYGPSACLAGFAIKYAEKGSLLYEKASNIAKQSAKVFIESANYENHALLEYIRLYQCCSESGVNDLFDMGLYADRLVHDLGKYLVKPHFDWLDDAFFMLVDAYTNNIQAAFKDINLKNEVAKQMEETAKYLMNTINCHGPWHLPEGWTWPTTYKGKTYNDYCEECAISRNWWRGYRVVAIIHFLRQFNYLQDYSV